MSLWDTLDGAKEFYNQLDENYTTYEIDNSTFALATPIKVYKFKDK